MAKRVVIDPITRIEGHLRIDVEVDAGAVQKAWASCTMWRGLEKILLGRDARDAWAITQRFCGVCTTVHAMASVRSVEDALKMHIPPNAQMIRNLILIAHALHDHIVHFYHLSALDWVDVATLPKADPKKAAQLGQTLSDWHLNSPQAMADVQRKVKGLLDGGQLGIFANGYWGHKEMRLPPEVNLLAVAHYLQALDLQRKANQIVGMLGGKTPHIQNLTVGGVMNAINPNAMDTLNVDQLYRIKDLLDEVTNFVRNVYFTDVCAVGANYLDWFSRGKGVNNYLCVPDLPTDERSTEFDLWGGVITDGDLKNVRPIESWQDAKLRAAVTEDCAHSWYEGSGPVHPWEGKTEPQYTDFQPDGKYSWVKSPRYEGRPTEVGPLATVLVGFARGHAPTVKWAGAALDLVQKLSGAKVGPEVLMSALGRHAARAIRACVLADLADKHWQRLVDNVAGGDGRVYNPPLFTKHAEQGVGFHEAPRGTLSHWSVVQDGKLANYQAVVPTTWNASPRDSQGRAGPYEEALQGLKIEDPEVPLEVIRVVHGFDPCMACACHTHTPDGKKLATVKVQ
ncbi:nickel-dependent hydrogenase large subunit [Myxococcota bacterium]|nr:nickel-dependent hydrogenase large subunit [Myxococcota bacterium]